MLQKFMARRRSEEEGFTLIELMVVVLIIAILIAIAIPTFLGARERAQNRAAQSSLRNALTAAKTLYTDNNDYTAANATALLGVEPSLTYNASGVASTGPKNISVNAVDASHWDAAVLSSSGKCYYIQDVSTGPGTTFGSGATCTGDAAATASPSGTSFP
jgi:type IV pilus assembly protein PilA